MYLFTCKIKLFLFVHFNKLFKAKQLYPETLNHLTHDVETDSSISLIGSNSSTENILSFNRKLVSVSTF